MANTNAPQGFVPVTPNARMNAYTIATGYGTAINLGDPVKLTGTGTGAYAGIEVAAATETVVGVFAGVSYTDSTGQPQWSKSWPASTTATNIIALVYDDPTTEFMVQYSGTFAVTDYGQKADFVAAVGTLGISGYYIAATGQDSLRIRRLYNSPNNAVGAYAKIIIEFLEHSYTYPMTAV
mgnify:CR=1 FL=1